ncbi:MAG: radical SAM protein, partial [Candidatus Omnitrophica bacterium]|nr:radical SAM protein [Candidatus Omnitrophota bacterium]
RSPEATILFFRRTLMVSITYRCNLSCRYCYVKGIKNDIPTDMSLRDFLSLAVWAKDKSWNRIRFLGGEPTIHPDFAEMLDICYKNKIYVSISTNNTFSPQIGAKFNKSWMSGVLINYVLSSLDHKQKTIFRNNLEQLNAQGIPFEFSYIISHLDDNWLEIFKDAKLYRPMRIRVSVVIPGLSKQTSVSELINNFHLISYKIFEFQENCIKLNIPFYIYRPLMPCMFSRDEWQRLKGDFPFICFTRCPLGAMGDYSATVVINPDLSIFPCIAVFLKGPNIFTFKDRKGISGFYKEKIKQMLSEPLMELCKNCERHRKFTYNLAKGVNSDLNSCFDESLCQSGCLNFKEDAQSLCHME